MTAQPTTELTEAAGTAELARYVIETLLGLELDSAKALSDAVEADVLGVHVQILVSDAALLFTVPPDKKARWLADVREAPGVEPLVCRFFGLRADRPNPGRNRIACAVGGRTAPRHGCGQCRGGTCVPSGGGAHVVRRTILLVQRQGGAVRSRAQG